MSAPAVYRYALANGAVKVEIPAQIEPEEIRDLIEWFELIEHQIMRDNPENDKRAVV